MKKEAVSRRNFLISAGKVAGGAAVGTMLAGCTTSPARTDAKINWDRETDVLIIGSGFAGMAAAVEAKKAGADVLVIEKNTVLGGNSIQCAGNIQLGGGTSTQLAAGIQDTWQRFYNDIFAYGHHRADPELLRAVCQHIVPTHDWFIDLGLNFRRVVTKDEGMTVACSHNAAPGDYPGSRGISQWYVIYKKVKEQGTEILTECKAGELITNADGAVIGAKVTYQGKPMYFKARKAVFLGSGGWKSNVAMRLNWDPRLDEDLAAGGAPFVETSGEMINAAVDIGAGMRDMSFVCEFRFKWGTKIYSSWDPPSIEVVPGGAGVTISAFNNIVLLKNGGVRFVDENAAGAYPQIPFYNAFLNINDKPRNVWAITDAAGAADLKWNLDHLRSPSETAAPYLSPSCVAVANTLEELGAKMGFPGSAVASEIAKYNGFVDARNDADFGKQNMGRKLAAAPYYAVKCQFFAHDQMGGLAVNTKGQILKRSAAYGPAPIPLDQQEVIPHLYGAGESVGGYVGEERGHGKIGLYIAHALLSAPHMAAETPIA
ncbi:FAD-dependent oxidoreductase [Breznakiella homolactica]|uniref:FAD-binding protein n=1 Tax=Breznakiella homolactica TaxID=2798577 RepID=A0A7T7XLZ7_9SPIR|nr:FAD-dependent oxidoreductase [Breznakiella homolactica]QQO08723.1 FAD-dependent oxidoreductase [Breznakiella homolactica]